MNDSQGFITSLTIVSYPKWAIPFAMLAMAIFRIPLLLNPKISFWRMMGTGKNGTFDKVPDLQKWAIMAVYKPSSPFITSLKTTINKPTMHQLYGNFIGKWLRLFSTQQHLFILQPIESHGLWNKKKVFGSLPIKSDYQGRIAVLTRATLRVQRLVRFWSHVDNAAIEMVAAEGFEKSYGIGEIPWLKQATFSIWNSKAHMQKFAYGSPHHRDIIKKTHAEKWYSEEMFTRFKVVAEFVSHN